MRLQQNATQWISAKGRLPTALFRPRAAERSGAAHGAEAAPGERVDLTIDSSPIDLGVVQGFTSAVTDVTGTLEAHVHVTGTADDPHPAGAVTIRDGAVTIERAGVSYAHIAGRVDLEPDRVHIDQITVLDNQDSALTLTGDLAVHERQVGDVKIYVTADDFKVVDNEVGNVRIHSRMEVAGELRSPRLEGYLGVTTGQVNLDEIIALTGPSPYATTPIEFVSPASTDNRPAPAPSVFDALKMDVHVTVPNDLAVKARSLMSGRSPIGLGALSVTLGGDLRATKEPGNRVRLVGTVNTVRGTYEFQGRRFEILRDGTIRFEGWTS